MLVVLEKSVHFEQEVKTHVYLMLVLVGTSLVESVERV